MGNFLVSCALSGLNIHPYEEIVVVPLFRQEHPQGNAQNGIAVNIAGKESFLPIRQNGRRPTDIYQIGLPFAARYDDAGGFHLDGEVQASAQWLVAHVAQSAIKVTNENTVHNCRDEFIPKEMPNGTEDALRVIQRAVNSGYLILGQKSHEKHSLSFAFVQKGIFDYVKAQSPVRDDLALKIERHVRYAAAETTLFMATLMNGEGKAQVRAKYRELCDANDPGMQRMFDLGLYGLTVPYAPSFMAQVGTYRHTWATPDSKKQYADTLYSMLDALDLNLFMDDTLHKCWQPSMYAGDQHDNVDMIRFNRFVEKKHLSRLETLYGDEFEDPFAEQSPTEYPASEPRL